MLMIKPIVVFSLLLVFVLAYEPLLQAQQIKEGTWTGTITDPNGKTSIVSYEVKTIGDSLSMTLISQAMGSFPLEGVDLEKEKIEFIWIPDIVVNCSLNQVDTGGYEGACLDSNGGKWRLKMIPPKAESFQGNQWFREDG